MPRVGGLVSVIGVLAQGGGMNPLKVLMKTLHLQGIFVGSRQMFEDLNRAVAATGLKPVIDRSFAFGQVPEALNYMHRGAHFGKIVIRMAD